MILLLFLLLRYIYYESMSVLFIIKIKNTKFLLNFSDTFPVIILGYGRKS